MCWVMPPASPATTLALRMRSSSFVLPWSTWPMTVMTGGRGALERPIVVVVVVEQLPGSSTSCSSPGFDEQDLGADLGGEQLDLSSVSDWVAVTISPCCSRKRTTSAAVRFSLGPSSWGVAPRSMTIVPSGTGASVGV